MDPIPSGNVTLCETLCLYVEAVYPGTKTRRHANGAFAGWSPDSVAVETPSAIDALVTAFREGELQAEVFSAEQNRIFALLRSDWEGSFPERMFLSPRIAAPSSEPLARYFGRTPFTDQAALSLWLGAQRSRPKELTNGQKAQTQCRIRDALFDKLHKGELKPEEAEAEAEVHGLEPLNPLPDPVLFDPMRKAYWSIPMVILWIANRNADDVRAFDSDYRAERREWTPHKYLLPVEGGTSWREESGCHLEPLHPVSTDILECYVGEEVFLPAWKDLLGKLQKGEIIATGVPGTGGARMEIPSYEWADLEANHDEAHREYFHYRQNRFGRAYTDILLPLAVVEKLWPQSSGAVEENSVSPPETVRLKPGRREKWTGQERNAFCSELIRLANTPDGLPATQAEIVGHMEMWCRKTWGDARVPSETTLKDWIRPLVNGAIADGGNVNDNCRPLPPIAV